MVRFKDVTKVGLVLALFFTFVGVGSADDNMTPCEKATINYKNLINQCRHGNNIEKDYEECAANPVSCSYSRSERAANKLDTEAFCAQILVAREFIENQCMDINKFILQLDIQALEEYTHNRDGLFPSVKIDLNKRNGNKVNQNKNGTRNGTNEL